MRAQCLPPVRPQVVLAPTREIAIQHRDVIMSIGRHIEGLHAAVFIGGTAVSTDRDLLRSRNCQVAVGTPGRLYELIVVRESRTRDLCLAPKRHRKWVAGYGWLAGWLPPCSRSAS